MTYSTLTIYWLALDYLFINYPFWVIKTIKDRWILKPLAWIVNNKAISSYLPNTLRSPSLGNLFSSVKVVLTCSRDNILLYILYVV